MHAKNFNQFLYDIIIINFFIMHELYTHGFDDHSIFVKLNFFTERIWKILDSCLKFVNT